MVAKTSMIAVKKAKRPVRSAFYKLRHKVGLGDRSAAAEFCCVTERTITNWDSQGSPGIAIRLLQLYDKRDFSGISEDWRGWKFSRGALVKGKMRFLPHSLESLPYVFDVFNRLQIARLRYEQEGISLETAAAIMLGASDLPKLTDSTQGEGVTTKELALADG
jgi:hypothetical protein